MVTLHKAIREIQEELIRSEQERIQRGYKPLFITEKLTIELSCVFSETSSSKNEGEINAFSILALDAESAKSISSEKIQKVILEFKTQDPGNESTQNAASINMVNARTIPGDSNPSNGMYPYRER